MSAMFRSFSVFNYRVWFIGALVSNVGQWMQGTALSWVVLTQLTHNDAGAMGITMALQFAPPLLLVGVTGWVADRFDRRRLVMLTQSLLLVIGAVIGVLILQAVLSWVNPYSPLSAPADQLTRPFLNPIRRVLPPLSGIDLSPLVAILLAQLVLMFL